MIQKLIHNSLILTFSLFVIGGCVSRKNSSSSGGFGYNIYTYNKGKDSTVYFASNIKFKGKNKELLVMDITYTAISNQENNIICNFSVFTPNSKFKPNSFKIKTNQPTKEINQFEKVYAEALKKDRYEYRYSILIPDKDFNALMNEKSPIIELNNNEFRPKGKFKKQAEQIRMKVLFDNNN